MVSILQDSNNNDGGDHLTGSTYLKDPVIRMTFCQATDTVAFCSDR